MAWQKILWSSRLVPCGASPSADPSVRLSRTGLLARLIHLQLSVDTDINSRTGQRILFQHFDEPIPAVAFLLASSAQSIEKASAHSIAEPVQAVGIVSDSIVMEVTDKNLIHNCRLTPSALWTACFSAKLCGRQCSSAWNGHTLSCHCGRCVSDSATKCSNSSPSSTRQTIVRQRLLNYRLQ